MDYSAIHDTWSYKDEDSISDFEDYYSERLVGSPCGRVTADSTLDHTTINHDDPTYVNIRQELTRPVLPHYGDRFKGLFIFLRETNAKKAVISSLQHEIELMLSTRSNCDLTTDDEKRFGTDIVIFATMIDNQLRRIRRRSEEQFNAISKKLTKLEMKGRSRTHSRSLFSVMRALFQRFLIHRNISEQ
ncbi:hypothetical protein Y032_0422g1195 [Ancylostoma ceylanicum]|nr:hypothetical protein Y032_0422g1195 [Ancylostoma ceylanicum]